MDGSGSLALSTRKTDVHMWAGTNFERAFEGVVGEASDVSPSTAKRAWARLIKQVYEVDPLPVQDLRPVVLMFHGYGKARLRNIRYKELPGE